MINIEIESEFAKLGQLLKFVPTTQTGDMAEELIRESLVKTNNEVKVRHSKELYPGDIVGFKEEKYVVG